MSSASLDPDLIVALLVYGPDISKNILEKLSFQLELFLEELDRHASGGESARFKWKTVDRSFEGNRVLVTPTPPPEGATARSAARIVQQARRGIYMLRGDPRRPPGFTPAALEHLGWLADAVESPGVTRIAFFASGMAETISQATRYNLRTLNESSYSEGGPRSGTE